MKERQALTKSHFTRSHDTNKRGFVHNRNSNTHNNVNQLSRHASTPFSVNNNNYSNSNRNFRGNINNIYNVNSSASADNVEPSIPSSHITPYAAKQDQPAQHSAAMVRSGMSNTTNTGGTIGSVMFYSSVQKKGGAFTSSEQETYKQLHCRNAIHDRQVKQAGTNSRHVHHNHSSHNIEEKFKQLQQQKITRDMASAKHTHEKGLQQFRHALMHDSDDDSDERDGGIDNV